MSSAPAQVLATMSGRPPAPAGGGPGTGTALRR
jgi:hypothetical protein